MKIETKIAVVGLGYVGLPLAVEFGKKIETIGFDINVDLIKDLKEGRDNKLSNKFLAILLEMNAIFYNAKDLNMFLEKDIESWWEKDITQKSRNLIVSEFGNFLKNYIKEVSLALTEYSHA